MKSSSQIVIFIIVLISICFLSSCTKEKAKEVLWDSGPVENFAHSGTYVGKVNVYTIDWLNYTKTRSDKQYRIYKKSNGEYVIEYEGNNYTLKKADEPFGEGIYALKWTMDYNHYIEDVPTSW